jgi:hypothetical protein
MNVKNSLDKPAASFDAPDRRRSRRLEVIVAGVVLALVMGFAVAKRGPTPASGPVAAPPARTH